MKYFVVAGEASGDMHAGSLMSALRERDPGAQFCFLGGDVMAAAAGHGPLVHYREMAFMGFVAVVRNMSAIRRFAGKAQRAIAGFLPDRLILVDYPGFNLRFARWVKTNMPQVEVDYYIAPKLWAWKEYRIKSIRRYVDRMFTIFPFETEWFARRGCKVEYVGNPTVDSVAAFRNQTHSLSVPEPDGRNIVALLPGSRLQEIRGCLPRMAQLAVRFPNCRFVVAAAPGVDAGVYRSLDLNRVEIVQASTYGLLSVSAAAVVNSGTATLETALWGVPQVVVYNVRGGAFVRLLKKLVIKVPYVSLVNIIAQRRVVTELLADRFTVDNMASEIGRLLNNDTYSAEMRKNYADIANSLGAPGAAARCAELILS